MERWVRHPVHTDYDISDQGRVRRATGGCNAAKPGRILNPGLVRGYHSCVVDPNTSRRVHRLVLEAFVGPRPDGCECLHINGIKTDNRLVNLRWGTHADNYADRVAHGGGNHGQRHGMAKLTDEQAAAIKREYAPGKVRQIDIANKYSVSRRVVGFIVNGQRWRHV